MIMKPSGISPNNISLDATFPITISWINSGDRQYKYRIQIYNNTTNVLVYDTNVVVSFNTFHVISGNTLIDGTIYKYQIQTFNQVDASATSNWILFKCSSTPSISFTNVIENDIIYNSQYLFTAQYSQLESVAIKSWQMIMYDSNNAIITTTSETFNSIIEYQFSGFNNNFYYIECQVKSQDDILASTNKIKFNIQYTVPESVLDLQSSNISDQGAINLQWNVVQIIGNSENTSYINGEKIDTTNGRVWFDSDFNIENDFTLKLWLESVNNNVYTINQTTSITSYNVPLTDTSIIWLDNSAQTTELSLNISAGNITPATNYLWIDDQTIVPRVLTPILDIVAPTTDKLWIDTGSNSSNDTSEILKMSNSNSDIILLRYYNGAFHLFENGIEIDNVSVNGSSYYLYLQQIGNILSLHAEVIV